MKIHEVVLLAESANTMFAVKVIDPKTGDEKTMEISALTATEAKSKVAGRTVDVDGEKKHYKVISVKSAWNEAKDVGKQLSVEQLATISDAALDSAYGYGRSQPGNTFGWQANLKSAAFAKQMIDKGVTDVEAISDAIHKGWNVTAQAFVKNPQMFDDSKTMAPEKLQAKIAQRQKLMTQQYAQLPEDEKEKDRVVAHAMLQAITVGQPGVEEEKAGLYANTHAKRERIKHGSGEHMRKPGTKGAPTSQSWKDAAKTAKTEAANPAQQAAIAIAKNKEKDVDEAIARKDRPVPSIQLAMKRSEKIPNSKVIKLGPNRGFIVVDRSDPRPEVKPDLNVLGKVNNAETRYKDLLSQMRRLEREYDVHGSTDWRERQERFRKMVQDTNYEQLKALKQAATSELKTQKAYQRHEETGDVSEGGKTGPKFTGYWKGKDKGKPGNKMVGDA
jgi:acid stress-induced BolA-like protein IbaG/YrbA